jgi:hypothetical protein
MHKAIKDRIVSYRVCSDEYSLRDKVIEQIYPEIVTSMCDKIVHDHYAVPLTDTNTPIKVLSTQEVNLAFLEEKFPDFPDEVKQLLNISAFLDEIAAYQVSARSSFGADEGNAGFEYKRVSSNTGDILITYNWKMRDEFGVQEYTDKETHVIPAVIYSGHQYYAITNQFIEWLRTPDKPKRQQFISELFYL